MAVKRIVHQAVKFQYYTFRQNNSGGHWTGPRYVIVRARSQSEAEMLAEENGVYFDGCKNGQDCSCCGDRWSRYAEVNDTPMIYGQPAEEYKGYEGREPDLEIVIIE